MKTANEFIDVKEHRRLFFSIAFFCYMVLFLTAIMFAAFYTYNRAKSVNIGEEEFRCVQNNIFEKTSDSDRFFRNIFPLYVILIIVTFVLLPSSMRWGALVWVTVLLAMLAIVCTAQDHENVRIASSFWSILGFIYSTIKYGSVLLNRLEFPMTSKRNGLWKFFIDAPCIYAAFGWNVVSEMMYMYLLKPVLSLDDNLGSVSDWTRSYHEIILSLLNTFFFPLMVVVTTLFSLAGICTAARSLFHVVLPFLSFGSFEKIFQRFSSFLILSFMIILFIVTLICLLVYRFMFAQKAGRPNPFMWPMMTKDLVRRSLMTVLDLVKIVDGDEIYRTGMYECFTLALNREVYMFVAGCTEFCDSLLDIIHEKKDILIEYDVLCDELEGKRKSFLKSIKYVLDKQLRLYTIAMGKKGFDSSHAYDSMKSCIENVTTHSSDLTNIFNVLHTEISNVNGDKEKTKAILKNRHNIYKSIEEVKRYVSRIKDEFRPLMQKTYELRAAASGISFICILVYLVLSFILTNVLISLSLSTGYIIIGIVFLVVMFVLLHVYMVYFVA